jgi:hypothetical protein
VRCLDEEITLTIKPTKEQADKKSYERPRLVVYGDIREITKSIGMSGGADGATHGSTKTQ